MTIEENDTNNNIHTSLKKQSTYYPEVFMVTLPTNVIYASTLVRVKKKGVWYVVHCVESRTTNRVDYKESLLMHLMASVHEAKYLYKVDARFDEVDSIQVSEKKRLREKYLAF